MRWIDVPFAPRYEVSDGGVVRIKSTGKVLKPFVDKKQEYKRVDLFVGDGKRKRVMVHVLVMELFRGKKPKGYEIDKINCDRADNRLENLRYVTQKDNRSNPKTVRNVRIGAIKGLLTKGVISAAEAELGINEINEEYGLEIH